MSDETQDTQREAEAKAKAEAKAAAEAKEAEAQRQEKAGAERDGQTSGGPESAAEALAEAETPEQAEAKEDAGIATAEENAALEHGAGGATTRDGTDAGVPMMQGDASEPVGPEDAFGEGQKRGDYSKRVSGSHAQSVPLEGGGEPILDDEGNVVDIKPKSTLVSQTERAGDQGEVPGEKGGVTTAA